MHEEHPFKRLRASLGGLTQEGRPLTQAAFGETIGLSQNRVSEIEAGSPLTPELALRVWDMHGPRLRGMGFSFERLVREYGTQEAARPFRPTAGEAA